jgi:hypothetical protein
MIDLLFKRQVYHDFTDLRVRFLYLPEALMEGLHCKEKIKLNFTRDQN